MTDIPNRGQNPPVGFTREEAVINGVRIVLHTGGEGPPFLFFHGGGTFHGIDFAREWTRKYRMILPYHPGFGPTSDHPGLGDMAAYLDHYEAVLRERGIERLVLGGISIGGWMATEFALRHPEMVEKLILVAPGGVYDPLVPLPDLNALPPGELLNHLAHDPRVFEPYLPKTEEDAAAFQAMLAGEGQSLAALAPQGPFRPGMEREFGRLTMPVLLLWGKEDRVLPPALAPFWEAALPCVDVHYFDDAGHTLLDESAAARKAVMDFLG